MKKLKLKLKKKTISALNDDEMLQSRGGSYYSCASDYCGGTGGTSTDCNTSDSCGSRSCGGGASMYLCNTTTVSICGPLSFYYGNNC